MRGKSSPLGGRMRRKVPICVFANTRPVPKETPPMIAASSQPGVVRSAESAICASPAGREKSATPSFAT